MDLKNSTSDVVGDVDDEKEEEKLLLPALHHRHVSGTPRIDPETLTDYFDIGGKSSGSGTIREAFDNQFEVFLKGCCRTWHQMLWRQAMLMIASHMDSGSPLNRIICLTIEDSSSHIENISNNTNADVKIAGGGCEEVKSTSGSRSVGDGGLQKKGIIIDILSIKQMVTSVSPNTPVVFIRYAVTTTGSVGCPSSHDLLLTKTADEFPNSCTIHCTLSEIESILSILEEESRLISSSYQKKWKIRGSDNGTSFNLSFIRPLNESLVSCVLHTKKVINRKESVQPRRQKQRFACSLPGCTTNAQHQCSICKTSYYCCVDHQKLHRSDHKAHCVPPPQPKPVEICSTLTESTRTPTTVQTNVSIVTSPSDSTSSSLVPPVTSISDAVATDSPPEFNPFVNVWPSTVGPGSRPPEEDIWDDSTPRRHSILVDLKNVSTLHDHPQPMEVH